MNKKKRVLWVSEASFLNTGFSVLTMEILKNLHETGKYELAELGSYAKSSDQRGGYLPWTFYGAIPESNDTLGQQRYNNSIYGQFGEAVFEQVCLDFKPDIVIDVRDYWMCEFQLRSPYRDYYKLIWMPTIDGEPQRAEWLDSYSRADMILTYSQYGKDVLEREAPNKIDVFDVVRPGVNHHMFKPLDKAKLRENLNINPNANIIMTVMRNQRRKLFPDLIETFVEYLKHCVKNGNEDLAKNTYLYLHTSYPDVGFDIARHVMQSGAGHRILTTYLCQRCQYYYSDFFQTELTSCPNCGSISCHMPNTQTGLTREQLVNIINMADLYIQYSICEGFGMPVAEAKACGIPAIGIDYSATSELVNSPGGMPIKVGKFFHEPILETEQKRALPDVDDAVKKIYQFFTMSKELRQKMSADARNDAVENHCFDRSARIFEQAIDSIETVDHENTWDNPEQRLSPIDTNIPEFNNNSEFVDWCITNIIGNDKLKNTYWRNDIIKGLNVGFLVERGGRQQCTPETIVNSMIQVAKNNNFWENIRVKPFNEETTPKWEII